MISFLLKQGFPYNGQLLSDFDIGWLSIICLTLDVENNLTNCRVANILSFKSLEITDRGKICLCEVKDVTPILTGFRKYNVYFPMQMTDKNGTSKLPFKEMRLEIGI